MTEEFKVTNKLSVGDPTNNIEITKDRIIIHQLSAIQIEQSNDEPLLFLEGALNNNNKRKTCVLGDLLIKDYRNKASSIIFHDHRNQKDSSAITLEEMHGKTFLFLEGALTGQDIKNRNTCIYGDLLLYSTEGSTNGNIISKKGDIMLTEGVVKATDVLINSSQEIKQDISTLTKEEAYSIINELEPVKFAFKHDRSKKENIGFIAENVPDIVSDNDHKGVRYMEIISALTKVVKDLKNEINELKEKINVSN